MKQKILVDYKETYDDSDWMTSGTDHEYKQVLELSSKEELIQVLVDIGVHKEIIKEVQEQELDFLLPVNEYFSHNETSGWYSQDFRLELTSKDSE